MKFDLVRPCTHCPFRSDRPFGLRRGRSKEIASDILSATGHLEPTQRESRKPANWAKVEPWLRNSLLAALTCRPIGSRRRSGIHVRRDKAAPCSVAVAAAYCALCAATSRSRYCRTIFE
jgi:hypothetical protein